MARDQNMFQHASETSKLSFRSVTLGTQRASWNKGTTASEHLCQLSFDQVLWASSCNLSSQNGKLFTIWYNSRWEDLLLRSAAPPMTHHTDDRWSLWTSGSVTKHSFNCIFPFWKRNIPATGNEQNSCRNVSFCFKVFWRIVSQNIWLKSFDV